MPSSASPARSRRHMVHLARKALKSRPWLSSATSFVGPFQGLMGHGSSSLTWSSGLRYPSWSVSNMSKHMRRKATPSSESTTAWSECFLTWVLTRSGWRRRSLSNLNFRMTVQVVSTRPRSTKSLWRKTKPAGRSASSADMPSWQPSRTTAFTPESSSGLRSWPKQRFWKVLSSRSLSLPSWSSSQIRKMCCSAFFARGLSSFVAAS
mmetsp:Transcript_26358/g.65982  ORF Transcript_26358/g.65982 Transcript_26358/m.65982 type:complete len:207 (+) Transcript_26358:1038-1658(+)